MVYKFKKSTIAELAVLFSVLFILISWLLVKRQLGAAGFFGFMALFVLLLIKQYSTEEIEVGKGFISVRGKRKTTVYITDIERVLIQGIAGRKRLDVMGKGYNLLISIPFNEVRNIQDLLDNLKKQRPDLKVVDTTKDFNPADLSD